jgi:hypothetical protein
MQFCQSAGIAVGPVLGGLQPAPDNEPMAPVTGRDCPRDGTAVRSSDDCRQAGPTGLASPRHVGGGKLIASVKDADGNVIGLIQPASGARQP